MELMNEMLLRRKGKYILSTGNADSPNHNMICTIMKNVESLRFTFSKELYGTLETLSATELKDFYLNIIPMLKNLIGADVKFEPMYPNFPEEVMQMDETILYLNAIIHYYTNGVLFPATEKEERLPLFDVTKVRVIDLGSMEDVQEIFTNLCQSKTSLSQTDKDDITYLIRNTSVSIPDQIPLKENCALIGKLYLENAEAPCVEYIQKYFKTSTDVLRLIVALSDGDISLASETKFRNFKRSERKFLLELLEGCSNLEEDVIRYKNRWIRVGERLHPKEYKKFVKVNKAFYKLRNGIKISTFAGKVEESIKVQNFTTALSLLSKRPGELARKIDLLLRSAEDKNAVVNTFKDVAVNVSTPVLLQVRQHFLNRGAEYRVFFPKGNLAKTYNMKNDLPPIEEKWCKAIVSLCENALVENYRKKEFMGNVYLSEDFRNYIVPFSQRSASKAFKSVVRGSRMPIPESTNALRGFIWWTNSEREMVDIDLSAAIFDENWRYMEHVSYTNLRSEKYKACHSGDIIDGGPVDGDGVSEFLDVDINSVLKYGARYVVYQVYSYSCQNYSDLPHVMFGWMNREDVSSGEIYEPKTVEQKLDLTCQSKTCVPVIFDCLKREIIWCDMNVELPYYRCGGNNLESNLSAVEATCYSVANISKPNLYDLIDLHIRARGVRVENKEDADIIFDIEDGITPYDLDVFMGEYL